MDELLDGLVPGLPGRGRGPSCDRAEGVPLYAVETVRMLLDRGLLVQEGRGLRLDRLRSRCSRSRRRCIADRGPTRRARARRARCSRTEPCSARRSREASRALAGSTERLERARALVVRRCSGSSRPALAGARSVRLSAGPRPARRLRDALASASDAARHLAAAEQLETGVQADQDEVIEVIASHYLDAYRALPAGGRRGRAPGESGPRCWRSAGERAASLAAAAEARRYFEQASSSPTSRRNGRRFSRAPARWRAGAADPEAGDGRSSRSRSRSTSAPARSHIAARVAATARLYGSRFTGRREEAVAQTRARVRGHLARRRLTRTSPSSPPGSALNYWFLGDLERSAERAELALDVAEAQGYPQPLSLALRSKGAVAFSRGHIEEAGALGGRALEIALEHDLSREAATSYFIVSDGEFRRDRYESALVLLTRLRSRSRASSGSRTSSGRRSPRWRIRSSCSAAGTRRSRRWRSRPRSTPARAACCSACSSRCSRSTWRAATSRRHGGSYSLFDHLEGSIDVQDRVLPSGGAWARSSCADGRLHRRARRRRGRDRRGEHARLRPAGCQAGGHGRPRGRARARRQREGERA